MATAETLTPQQDILSAEDQTTTDRQLLSLEQLAYLFWMERGCPVGSPEIDWFRAEEALNKQSQADALAVAA